MSTQEHTSQPLENWADNFTPVIPVNHAVHTPENPFCDDPSCPCHEEDSDSIEMVNQAYQDGIITSGDASDIVKGVKQW
jgi:hypothetical protein